MTQVCQNRYLISKGHRPFVSKSDPTKKPYKAYAFRPLPELPMCTCMPFLTGRKKQAKALNQPVGETVFSCSHLKRLFAETCDYIQTSTDEYQWSGKCPKCGDPLVDTDQVDMPDDPDAQVDDLRKMLAELQGIAPPVTVHNPEPEPTPVATAADPGNQAAVNDLLDDLRKLSQ